MPTYIISTHGNPDWTRSTTVPANMSVRFYQAFGNPMNNQTGLQLQSALANPAHPGAAAVLTSNPQVALWNTGDHQPEINLTGDNHHFYSGIVCADTNEVVLALGVHQLITLSYALQRISQHAAARFPGGGAIVVHCLFCL